METILSIYNMLGMDRKIADKHIRITYLKEVWGLPQKTIAVCECTDQPNISRILKESCIKHGTIDLNQVDYNIDEIILLHMLPREILPDVTLIAFVENILGVHPIHPYYNLFFGNDNLRIMALSSLGIQQIRLEKLFKKTQSSISMMIKRANKEDIQKERSLRETITTSIKIVPKKNNNPFILAGGSQYINRIN